MKLLGVVYSSNDIQKSISRGSTDMGNVSYECPSIHPVFDIGSGFDIHSEGFRDAAKGDLAHKKTMIAIVGMVMTAYECTHNKDLLKQIVEEFKNSLE